MKKQLLSLALATLMSVGTLSAQTTCGIDGGATVPDAPAVSWTNDNMSPPILGVTAGSLPDYDLVVTMPEATVEFDGEQLTGEFIVGVTHDGVFDFSGTNDVTGAAFELGQYKFTAFAYDQAELDDFVINNGALVEQFFGVTLSSPAVLSEIFDVIAEISGPVTIVDVEDAICNLLTPLITPVALQYDVAYSAMYAIDRYGVGIDGVYTETPALAINNISPIPAVNHIDISLTSNAFANNIINIYDLTGKLVDAIETNKNDLRLDISSYNVGMYFISVSNGTETVNSKFYKR
ncbi:MAG: T9SS type A sorting domain-containing protein [Chitinophagales bacterium]